MGCNYFETKDPKGEVIAQGFICTSGKTKRCQWCSEKMTKLCDFQIRKRTCDAKMCDKHSNPVGENKDYCPNHTQRAPSLI